MKNYPLLLLSAGVLAGCATAFTGQTQDVTVLTPGAQHAVCYLYNDQLHYKVRTGETVRITKSNQDLTVDCLAPGNRQNKIVVPRNMEPSALLNVGTAVAPGVTYDHFSRGLYYYPEVITVDFTGIPARPYPLPAYMDPAVQLEENKMIENYGSSKPAFPGERYQDPDPVQKRDWSRMQDDSFLAPAPSPLPVTEK